LSVRRQGIADTTGDGPYRRPRLHTGTGQTRGPRDATSSPREAPPLRRRRHRHEPRRIQGDHLQAAGPSDRTFLTAATNRSAETNRSALIAQLTGDGIPEAEHDALLAIYKDLHEKARAGTTSNLALKGTADLLAVKQVRHMAARDDPFEGDHIASAAADTDRDDADKMARHVVARTRGLNDQQFEAEEADRAERARLARLGYTPAT
jgi:hypothetical protein